MSRATSARRSATCCRGNAPLTGFSWRFRPDACRFGLVRRLVPLAGILAALVLAPAALAADQTYCVNQTGCDVDEPDLQTALTDAALNTGSDTILIGAGTLSGPAGYTYPVFGDALTITGAGSGTGGTEL